MLPRLCLCPPAESIPCECALFWLFCLLKTPDFSIDCYSE
nr:MAG TPA: hypothetical protein [Caudoviricetes sp.]